MKKKTLLVTVLLIILLYPLISAIQAAEILGTVTIAESVERSISLYHLSIWLTWLVFVSVAIFYKWTTQKNTFFHGTYIFLILAYLVYGYFIQEMLGRFNIQSSFQDSSTLVVLTAMRNLVAAAALTGILQAGVWWFTRRWHRR
jgi:predicted Na+-dependent transporter